MTNDFDPEQAETLVNTASEHDLFLKVHYTDWLKTSTLEKFPDIGIGAAKVGPEFAASIVEALGELEEKENQALGEGDESFAENRPVVMAMSGKKEEKPESGPLQGLTDLLQSLDDLAETGKEVQEEFKEGKTGIERKVSVRHIAPSGKPGLEKRKKKRTKPEPTMEKVKAEPEERERLIDVFDRGDHVMVVAIPPRNRGRGFGPRGLWRRIKGKSRNLGRKGRKKYIHSGFRLFLEFPLSYSSKAMSLICSRFSSMLAVVFTI